MKEIWQFLGLTQNTIGRGRYFIANIIASIGLPLAISLLTNSFSNLFENQPVILYPLIILFIGSIIFSLVVYIKTSISRMRDIGMAQIWWVFAIIPLVNIPFSIFLCLKRGGSNGNDFENAYFTQQFKRFFSYELTGYFLVLCFIVILAGAIHALFVASRFRPFFESFGLGWWGVIALLAVFLVNILIAAMKHLKHFVLVVIKKGGEHIALIKNNVRDLPTFQRYLLLIALLMFITLAFILIKL